MGVGMVLITIMVMVLVFFHEYWTRIWKLTKLPRLPTTCLPVLGHVLSFPADPDQFFRFLRTKCREYVEQTEGKVVTVWYAMNGNPTFLHPDAAQKVLSSQKHLTKSSDYQMITPWIRTGLVTSTGAKWRTRRKLITPAFHYDILKDFVGVMNDNARVLVQTVAAKVDHGEKIDVKHHLKMCTLDVICETAMGCKMNAQTKTDNEYVEAVQRMSDYVHVRLTQPWLMNSFVFDHLSSWGAKQRATLKVLHDFSGAVVERRMKEAAEAGDHVTAGRKVRRKALVDLLISSRMEDGSSLSMEDIQEEVDTFMFGGHDTTAIALTWVVYLLGRHPEEQEKVHAEIDAVFADQHDCDVMTGHLGQLHYCEQVIKEAMRLFPPVPIVARVLGEELHVDGQLIPAGTNVDVFLHFIMRNPRVFERPDRFVPARFGPDRPDTPPFAHIPFSAGPRNCVGQRFALQELKLIMVHWFRRFRVVAHESEDEIKLNAGLVMEMSGRLDIDVHHRRSVAHPNQQ